MKGVLALGKILGTLGKWAGLLIIIGETIEYGQKLYEKRYPNEEKQPEIVQ